MQDELRISAARCPVRSRLLCPQRLPTTEVHLVWEAGSLEQQAGQRTLWSPPRHTLPHPASVVPSIPRAPALAPSPRGLSPCGPSSHGPFPCVSFPLLAGAPVTLGEGPPLPPEPPLSNLTSHIWDEPTPGKATCRGPRNHMHLGTLFSWGHVGGFPQVHKCAGMETLSSTSELWPRRSCAEKWVCVGGLGTGDREPGAALCPTDPLG